MQFELIRARKHLSTVQTLMSLCRMERAHVVTNAVVSVEHPVTLRALKDPRNAMLLRVRSKHVYLVEAFVAERTFVVLLVAVSFQVTRQSRVVHESLLAKLLECTFKHRC